MRIAIRVCLFLVCVGNMQSAQADPAGVDRFEIPGEPRAVAPLVYLDAPGVLDELRQKRPKHYLAIASILREVPAYRGAEASTWLKTRFNASDVDLSNVWLVSFPPKRDLSFTLEGTRYSARIVVHGGQVEAEPLPRAGERKHRLGEIELR